jgi:alkylated DNA repair dioxygenase AlkB
MVDGVDVPLFEGAARYWPRAFTIAESARHFEQLRRTIDWRHEEVLIFGRRRSVPRLVAWYGDPIAVYGYSGTRHAPVPWTNELELVRQRVADITGLPFNGVLLNLYRDGQDGMGWHSDNEPELGREPSVASVSFGAPRRFRLKHRRRRTETMDLLLDDGSLLLMHGETQHNWLHSVPKTSRPTGERVNLSFRLIVTADGERRENRC